MNLGIRNKSRNPSAIANDQHNDSAGAQKNLGGSAAVFESILSASSAVNPLEKRAVLRVANTSASWQYVFVGSAADAPGGAPAIGTGLGMAPNSVEMIFTDDTENLVVKSSSDTVQIAIIKP